METKQIEQNIDWNELLSEGQTNLDQKPEPIQKHGFCIHGYDATFKTAKQYKGMSSSIVYLPKSWEGKRIAVVLLE